MDLTPTELGRRLCHAAHPHLANTQTPVPCGPHLTEAQRYWGLLQAEGTGTLEVILQARLDARVASPPTLTAVARQMAIGWVPPAANV